MKNLKFGPNGSRGSKFHRNRVMKPVPPLCPGHFRIKPAAVSGLLLLLMTIILSSGGNQAAWAGESPRPGSSLSLEYLFQKYLTLLAAQNSRTETMGQPDQSRSCPGWIVGHWAPSPLELSCQPWPYRARTYEIIFPNRISLGRAVYSLALFTKDISPSLSLDDFSRGVQGFHYSIEQVTNWINTLRTGKEPSTDEQSELLAKLLADKVLIINKGRYSPSGHITHVLGAAAGRTRSLQLNLNHERYHVLWDEDLIFKARYMSRWHSLSDAEKKEVYESLKKYNLDDERQVIEEWAVRQNEARPVWEKN